MLTYLMLIISRIQSHQTEAVLYEDINKTEQARKDKLYLETN
uniref:YrzI family small protein n=1 Tax=Heterorhabditis bacteriophora TaxID=37862 RepID=A0A1I7WGL3_HETBA